MTLLVRGHPREASRSQWRAVQLNVQVAQHSETRAIEETSSRSSLELRLPVTLFHRYDRPDLSSGFDMGKLRKLARAVSGSATGWRDGMLPKIGQVLHRQ